MIFHISDLIVRQRRRLVKRKLISGKSREPAPGNIGERRKMPENAGKQRKTPENAVKMQENSAHSRNFLNQYALSLGTYGRGPVAPGSIFTRPNFIE